MDTLAGQLGHRKSAYAFILLLLKCSAQSQCEFEIACHYHYFDDLAGSIHSLTNPATSTSNEGKRGYPDLLSRAA